MTAAVTAAAAIAVIYFGGDGPSGSDAATNTAATALADAATNTAIAVVQVAAPVAAGAAEFRGLRYAPGTTAVPAREAVPAG